MDIWPYIFIGFAGVASGVISGISGGGGGMLMIPAFILAGLPPQYAVATGKMNGLGAAFGGLTAFMKSGQIRKDIVRVMIPIAIIVGITTPFIFAAIDSDVFQLVLGIVLILMIPTLFIKKKDITVTRKRTTIGYVSYTGVLALQAIFGTGVGSLALFALTLLLGTTKLEANATKRAVTAVLTPITFVALLIGGYVVLSYGIVGFLSVFVGTHVGSKIALKRGEEFVGIFMAITIGIAGVMLVYNAIT
jgi:uncharacterized membrane protein YfcA